jgi:MFS family permease
VNANAGISTAPTDLRHAWLAVALISLASMVGYLDRSLLTLLVAPVRADLGISGTEMSLLLGFAFAVFMGIASLPIAWLADRYDRSRILAAGILLWSLMTGLGAYAESFGTLFASRVGVGIGEAVLVPVGAALIAELFPREQLGRANSFVLLGTATGAGLALVAGGAVIHWVTETGIHTVGFLEGFRGWQASFLLAALPGIPLALLVFLLIRDPRSALPRRTPQEVKTPTDEFRPFVRTHRRTLVLLCLAYPLAAATTNGWLAWAPTFMMQKFALNPLETGQLFGGLILFCGVLGIPLGGAITDRLFRRRGGDAAIRLSIGTCLALGICGALAPFATGLPSLAVALGLYFFCANIISIMPILAMQLITPPPLRARMIAMLTFISVLVGGGLGPTAVALISEGVFGSMGALGNALSLTSLLFCPVTALMLMLVRRPFVRSLADNTN